jgi:hypothetical protein
MKSVRLSGTEDPRAHDESVFAVGGERLIGVEPAERQVFVKGGIAYVGLSHSLILKQESANKIEETAKPAALRRHLSRRTRNAYLNHWR